MIVEQGAPLWRTRKTIKKEEKMKNRTMLFGVFVIALAGLVLFSSAALAKPIELSLALIIPPRHLRYINVLDPWIKMIDERTGGKVKVTPYFSSALATPPETFDAAVSGVADICEGIAYATPGRFPLSETVMLPELGLKTGLSCSRALWQVYKTTPEVQAEYAGVKVLWLHVTPAVKLILRKKSVRTLEELKGLKLRVSGATAVKTGRALGFTPVSMPIGDVYLGLEKGVIDGAALPSELLISRRLGEVSKYVTDIDLGHDTFFVVMNQKTWNKLPQDIQKVFEELSGDWAVDFTGKAWDGFDGEAETKMKAKGFQYITLDPKEEARWKRALAPVREEYAAELEARGLPGKEILRKFEELAGK